MNCTIYSIELYIGLFFWGGGLVNNYTKTTYLVTSNGALLKIISNNVINDSLRQNVVLRKRSFPTQKDFRPEVFLKANKFDYQLSQNKFKQIVFFYALCGIHQVSL